MTCFRCYFGAGHTFSLYVLGLFLCQFTNFSYLCSHQGKSMAYAIFALSRVAVAYWRSHFSSERRFAILVSFIPAHRLLFVSDGVL